MENNYAVATVGGFLALHLSSNDLWSYGIQNVKL